MCRCLAEPKRLMILSALKKGEMSVGEICKNMGCSQANVSQHLAVLRNQGIVSTRREGVNIYYSLRSARISEACSLVQDFLLQRLEDHNVLVSDAEHAV
ncbi:MAG: metalloregulator ArsR/SmtB family transcription factor [Dehalococcoidia bacterium]|nr:metalloregulator ArsR/SmtB family transcription factor [Dehalococcoidia bacterium]